MTSFGRFGDCVGEQLIGEEDPLPLLICRSMPELVVSLKPRASILIREQLNILEFLWFETKFLSGDLQNCFTINAGLERFVR